MSLERVVLGHSVRDPPPELLLRWPGVSSWPSHLGVCILHRIYLAACSASKFSRKNSSNVYDKWCKQPWYGGMLPVFNGDSIYLCVVVLHVTNVCVCVCVCVTGSRSIHSSGIRFLPSVCSQAVVECTAGAYSHFCAALRENFAFVCVLTWPESCYCDCTCQFWGASYTLYYLTLAHKYTCYWLVLSEYLQQLVFFMLKMLPCGCPSCRLPALLSLLISAAYQLCAHVPFAYVSCCVRK